MHPKLEILEPYKSSEFEDEYTALRQKEQRLLADDEVRMLPYLTDSVHADEWKLRAESAERFRKYLHSKGNIRLLEIGCGNGWFSHFLAQLPNVSVTGQDINLLELQQADRVFKRKNLRWLYVENFQLLKNQQFDIVVFNASFQYFKHPKEVLGLLKHSLKNSGEIHVFDTPIYRNQREAEKAQKRSEQYYQSKGFAALARFYFHHTWAQLPQAKVMYSPSKVGKLLGKKNPFPWLRFKQADV